MRKLVALGRINVEVVSVEKKKMPFKRQLGVSAAVAVVLLNAAPALADESGDGFFSGLFSGVSHAISTMFHSSEPAPVEVAHTSPEVSPTPTDSPIGDSQESDSTTSLDSRFSSVARVAAPSVASTSSIPSIPSGPVTQDSSVSISGSIPGGAHWMMVMIQKENEKIVQDVTPTSEGLPIPMIYLHQGPGKYNVWLYASKSLSKSDNTYQFFSSTVVNNVDTRDNAFLLPSLNVQSNDPDIVALSAEITRGLSTDREKALAIHDWLTREVTYDVDGIHTNSFLTRPQDAKDVAQTKLAVCDGFSNLFAALSRAAGIQTKVVTGPLGVPASYLTKEQMCEPQRRDPNLHAWNEVYVDNRWVTVDSTLDAGSDHTELSTNGPDRTYFDRTPNNHTLFDPSSSFFEHDHTKCTEEVR